MIPVYSSDFGYAQIIYTSESRHSAVLSLAFLEWCRNHNDMHVKTGRIVCAN